MSQPESSQTTSSGSQAGLEKDPVCEIKVAADRGADGGSAYFSCSVACSGVIPEGDEPGVRLGRDLVRYRRRATRPNSHDGVTAHAY